MSWIIKRESPFYYLGLMPSEAFKKGEGPWRFGQREAMRFGSLADAREALEEVRPHDSDARVVRLKRSSPQSSDHPDGGNG